MLAKLHAHSLSRSAERRRSHVGGRPAQRAEAAHVDLRLRFGERGVVVVADIEISHALGVRQVIQPAGLAALEQERGLHPPVRHQLAHQRRERGPVRRRQRLPVAAEMRDGDVRIASRRTHRGHETRVQERHVGRRRERHVGINGLQAREQTLQRALPLARVLDHPDPLGQLRQILAGSTHDDDRATYAPRHDAARPSQERGAVPVQPRLRRAHAARAAAREHDSGGH